MPTDDAPPNAPSIGRIVHVWDPRVNEGDLPVAAIVTYVHPGTLMVEATGFLASGKVHPYHRLPWRGPAVDAEQPAWAWPERI